MNFPFFIARRYLFAKKSHNVINVISGISMAGIALAAFALICTLSVFNGFHSLVETLLSDFDPELKVVRADGSVIDCRDSLILSARNLDFVRESSFSLEEQALVQYQGNQQICMIKGVDDAFHELTGIENLLRGNGIYMLEDDICDYAIPGVGLMSRLECGINPVKPLSIYIPRPGNGAISPLNPGGAFNQAQAYSPGVVFMVNQEKYDDNYLLVSLDLARRLTGRSEQASDLEIALDGSISIRKAKRELTSLLGPEYLVQDRVEQQMDVFKVVKLEKFISYLFLSFILLIACFNIISSLIMLIIDKQSDAWLLESMGATTPTVEKIFITNGMLISLIGALAGLALGIIAVLLQQKFGFIRLGQAGSFVVDAYPVHLKLTDVAIVLATVLAVSFLAVRPIGPISKKFIGKAKE